MAVVIIAPFVHVCDKSEWEKDHFQISSEFNMPCEISFKLVSKSMRNGKASFWTHDSSDAFIASFFMKNTSPPETQCWACFGFNALLPILVLKMSDTVTFLDLSSAVVDHAFKSLRALLHCNILARFSAATITRRLISVNGLYPGVLLGPSYFSEYIFKWKRMLFAITVPRVMF